MKKLFFTVMLSAFVFTTFAQKKVLRNANRELRRENYEEAAKLAMEASNHEDTKDNPDVYMILGKVNMQQYSADKTMVEKAQAALGYFQTAYEKGDDKLKEQMMTAPVITRLPGSDEDIQTGGSESLALLERWMLLDGNDALNVDEYDRAYKLFAIAAEINPSDELNFFVGYAAESAGMSDKMFEYYSKVVDSEADTVYSNANFAYNGVIQHYIEKEEFNEALEVIRKAQKTFPEDELYAKWEVDVLIDNNMMEEAITGLDQVIASGKADAQVYTQLAFLYWQDGKLDKSVETSTKAVEMDASNYDANYVLGGAMYDQAADILREAGNPDIDDATYNKLRADAKKRFEDAKPYFEKCLMMKPDDSALFAPLSTIYEQLGMPEKRDEMLAKLDALDSGN